MYKVSIVEDELANREELKQLIASFYKDKLVVVSETESVVGSIEAINKHQPDILLLDVQLKDGLSFEIFDQLNNSSQNIVFITGYDDQAIKAIKLGALDYMIKPIDEEEFCVAIDSVIEVIQNKQIFDTLLMTNVSKQNYQEDTNQLILRTSEAIHLVELNHIIYCKSEGNYTTFYLEDNREILISKPLKYSLSLLPDDQFVRCQQSYIVNTSKINSYLKSGYLLMCNKAEVPVSGPNRDMVLKRIFN